MSFSAVLLEPSPVAEFQPSTHKHTFRIPGYLWALVTLLAVFLALELVTRFVLVPASKDFSRFATYGKRADQLLAQPGNRIVFIGNSTTQFGVDATEIQKQLRSSGLESACDLLVADASKINTWYYICNRFFWSQNRNPDLYVVNFYENNLVDGNPIEIGRVAQYFTRFSDWPEILNYDLPKMNERVEFVASSFWMTLAARDRIKQRVLKTAVPAYEEFTAKINQQAFDKLKSTRENAPPRTHAALKRFLQRAKDSNAHVCFVAFPTRNCAAGKPYDLNPDTLNLIEQAGFSFCDLRHVTDLKPQMYRDELHLLEDGREIYSRILAQTIANPLKSSMLSAK